MKSLFLTYLTLLGFTSPLFAVYPEDFLTDDLKSHQTRTADPYKEVDSPHQGRSDLYRDGGLHFPRCATAVHPYNTEFILCPFSGEIPPTKAQAPHSFLSIVDTELSRHTVSYAFMVQAIGKGGTQSLKPQYWLFPNAPTQGPDSIAATVRWTTLPGAEGIVLPASPQKTTGFDPKTGLITETGISIHPQAPSEENFTQVLSGNVMHLAGISPDKSVDFYDLVAVHKDGSDRACITYRWMLNEVDLKGFNDTLARSRSFQDLITNLEGLSSFPPRLNELKKFIGLSPRTPLMREFLGSNLPSQINRKVDTAMEALSSDTRRFLTFGPYIFLPNAFYNISVSYTSDASTDVNVGSWDISSNKGRSTHYKASLFGTAGHKAKLSILLPLKDQDPDYEIRTIFERGHLKVHKIKIRMKAPKNS